MIFNGERQLKYWVGQFWQWPRCLQWHTFDTGPSIFQSSSAHNSIVSQIICMAEEKGYITWLDHRIGRQLRHGLSFLFSQEWVCSDFFSAIVSPWVDFGLPPHCPQVVWCHWGEIEPLYATLAQNRLAECDQPGKNPLKYSAMAGNWTRATGRTDSEIHSFSHWAIMTYESWITYIPLKWVTSRDTTGAKAEEEHKEW